MSGKTATGAADELLRRNIASSSANAHSFTAPEAAITTTVTSAARKDANCRKDTANTSAGFAATAAIGKMI